MASTEYAEVDRDACLGNGACAYAAPHVFEVRAGISTVVGEATAADVAVREAVDACPVGALRWVQRPS